MSKVLKFSYLLIYVSVYFGLFTSIFYLTTLYLKGYRVHTKIRLKRYPKVAIIVPCFNEAPRVGRTIESLLNLDYPKNKLEIIVVDDGSKDGTYYVVKRFEKYGVKVYRKNNGGKHTAINYGLLRTDAEFVGCLDADSTVEPLTLKKILSRFTSPNIMAVTPSMKIEKPKGFLRRMQSIEYMLGIFLRRVFADLNAQHVTPGPFTIFRKRFFNIYGFYKKAYMTEDIELSLRMQSHNYHIENATDAYVWTRGPATFKGLYRQRVRWYSGFIKNIIDYKHLFSLKYSNLGVFVLPSALVSVFLVIVSGIYFLGRTLWKGYTTLNHYYLIDFDIFKIFKLNFDSFFINTNSVVIVGTMALILSIFLLFLSYKISQEKRLPLLSYIYFFFFYWLLFGLWWFSAFLYVVLGKKVSWGGNYEEAKE